MVVMHVSLRDRVRVAPGEEALPPLPEADAVYDDDHKRGRGDRERCCSQPDGARAVERHFAGVVARGARSRLRHGQPEPRCGRHGRPPVCRRRPRRTQTDAVHGAAAYLVFSCRGGGRRMQRPMY